MPVVVPDTTRPTILEVRRRLPPLAVLGALGLLAAGSAVLGATGTPSASSAPSSAPAFARSLLSEAIVPPGGQPTAGIHTLDVRWLGGWGATPGVHGVVGAHDFYEYDEPSATVLRYIEAHLPRGAIAGTGTHDGTVQTVVQKVPVSGPDEYLAELTYQVAATDATRTTCELRIDAKTVWVPPRPKAEYAPTRGVVDVTGFKVLSVMRPPTGRVTVAVTGRRAENLIAAFDSLLRGPSSIACMEDETDFTFAVGPRVGAPPTFRVTEEECENVVDVSAYGKVAPALTDRGCELLRAVAAVLPPRARATRAAKRCAVQTRVG